MTTATAESTGPVQTGTLCHPARWHGGLCTRAGAPAGITRARSARISPHMGGQGQSGRGIETQVELFGRPRRTAHPPGGKCELPPSPCRRLGDSPVAGVV